MKKRTEIRRCVIGEVRSMPNKLSYISSLSSRRLDIWVGHCAGDKTHKEHLIIIKKEERNNIIYKKSDSFKNYSGKTLGERIFPRRNILLCPEGKSFMRLQKAITKKIGMKHVDVLKCRGHVRGSGHSPHFVKVQQGFMEVKIYGKKIPVIIVSFQK